LAAALLPNGRGQSDVQSTDFKGLRRLREIVGAQFVTGIVLYGGTHALPFGEGLWAVPLARL
jgi:hypothetical protein